MAKGAKFDPVFAALLRGEDAEWPAEADGTAIEVALQRIARHGIAALLADSTAASRTLPGALLAEVRVTARLHEIRETSGRAVLKGLLLGADAAGLDILLLKGARLAYSLYDKPHHRMRGDTDMLVRQADLKVARGLLVAQGFRREAGRGDGLHQEPWHSPAEFGQSHVVDLHWRMTNSPAINSRVFDADPFHGAVMLPDLCEHARGVDAVTCLLHVALNQAWHAQKGFFVDGRNAGGGDRLGWVYDTHLLAQALTAEQWSGLEKRAEAAGAAPVVAEALGKASALLGTPLPEGTVDRLAKAGVQSWLTRYLGEAELRERLRHDFPASTGWREKMRLIQVHLAPPEEALRARYPSRNGWPLWALRVARLARLLP